jgi:type IV pilus assembly protein PilE
MTFHRPRSAGFTLIELMIVVIVVATLAAIAFPSYTEYVNRARRTEGRGVLLEAAQWVERFRAENNGSYVGAALPVQMQTSPVGSAAPAYNLTLTNLTAATYLLSLVPVATGPMAGDACGTMTLDQTGLRTAAGSSTSDLARACWNR